jgi:hypothetical protein
MYLMYHVQVRSSENSEADTYATELMEPYDPPFDFSQHFTYHMTFCQEIGMISSGGLGGVIQSLQHTLASSRDVAIRLDTAKISDAGGLLVVGF